MDPRRYLSALIVKTWQSMFSRLESHKDIASPLGKAIDSQGACISKLRIVAASFVLVSACECVYAKECDIIRAR